MGRKNGKTGLCSVLALAHLCGPMAEPRGQIYSAAADRKQAALLFDEMVAVILAAPALAKRCTVRSFTKDITDTVTGSKYVALAAEAPLVHGLNPSLVIVDELAQASNRTLYDALASAMGARAEPLLVVISTQAADDHHVLSELVDYAAKLEAGEVVDPTFHGRVYPTPLEADPWTEAGWYLANPSLGDIRSLEEMRAYANRARHTPALEASFRSLYLNQRVAAEAGLFGPADWAACQHKVDPDSLSGQRCYGGLDLSLTKDLSAFVLYFPTSGSVLCWFWLPLEGLREREDADGVPWLLWCREGYLEATPGKTVDKRVLAQRIGGVCQGYDVAAIAYDRWGFPELERTAARSAPPSPATATTSSTPSCAASVCCAPSPARCPTCTSTLVASARSAPSCSGAAAGRISGITVPLAVFEKRVQSRRRGGAGRLSGAWPVSRRSVHRHPAGQAGHRAALAPRS